MSSSADSGRSLIEHQFYGINGYAETNISAGITSAPWVMGTVWGYNPVLFLHAMAVFGTLAFLASYELFRRQAPLIVAAAICLLLMTSVTHFKLVTQVGMALLSVCLHFNQRSIDRPESRGLDRSNSSPPLGSFVDNASRPFPDVCFRGNCLLRCNCRERSS